MLSVIIPARNEPYLQQTVDEVFRRAAGDVECIVVLDGWWPAEPLKDRPGLKLAHFSDVRGMRECENAAARVSQGNYIMKLDAHCALCDGYDKILTGACDDNMIVVPVRYRLDVDTWERTEKPCEFQYIRKTDLKGKDWPEYVERVNGQLLPDLMTFQGSCWLMRRETWQPLDVEKFGRMGREAQELCLRVWLSGGIVTLCRYAWYAHWDKNTGLYGDMGKDKAKSLDAIVGMYSGKMQSLIERFYPVPTWN